MFRFILLFILILPVKTFGQNYKAAESSADSIIPATFKGDLQKFLVKTLKYPPEAVKEGIQGKVVVAFSVDTNGVISNPRVEKSVHESLDNEALRLIRLMPPWNPATQNGKTVMSEKSFPVIFRVTEK
ncbi:energy transducer TonB [Sporocytophaga myxococcoides]|uniref:energy transducer TonB n=1 Tax=Sporocytophaga myxococcoides TaxID=153721 RepID=UPI00041AA82B|nr:energy transducer TonB [Sporocytophaga myxococcoides]